MYSPAPFPGSGGAGELFHGLGGAFEFEVGGFGFCGDVLTLLFSFPELEEWIHRSGEAIKELNVGGIG